MKKLIFCLFTALILNIIPAKSQSTVKLMPQPVKVIYGKSSFSLSGARFVFSNKAPLIEQQSIDNFISSVKKKTGISILKSSAVALNPTFVINCDYSKPSLPIPNEKAGKDSREAYQVKVTSNKITITAKSGAGIFYGLQTLDQLIQPNGNKSYIPEVTIEDYPSIAYRGIMFDVSHGGMPTVQEIKRQLDFLSYWKINQYFFYNEVGIELKGYPLININSHYTQREIKEIINYAKQKFIQIVPATQLYGHLHELFKIEKYSGLSVVPYGHELDPRKPQVHELLKDWIKQYAQLFPSPFFHIGFDETWETIQLSKGADTALHPKKLYTDELDFVTKELEKYGKIVMLWSDITSDYPDIVSQFPKKVIPVVWEYSHDTAVMNNWIRPVTKYNFPYFIQSGVDGWQHIYPDDNYTYDNIDLSVKSCLEYGAIGYSTSAWSDAIQTLMRNSWIYLAYGGITSWQGAAENRNDFLKRYCELTFPGISDEMMNAFKKMNDSQMYFEKCFHESHTLPHMFVNPFSEISLKNTDKYTREFKQARLAAEDAEESLLIALKKNTADSEFVRTLLLNARLLDYTGMRFLFAKTIVDYWNDYVRGKGIKESWIMFYDIEHSEHGLTDNLLEYISELKPEYQAAWLSQYTSFRMNDMLGRFEAEYAFWYNVRQKIQYYKHNFNIDKNPATFRQTFKSLIDPLR